MTPERWQQLDRLFQSAVDLPPDHRGSYLDQACAGDAELRREVESLIDSHDEAGSFIEDAALPGDLRADPAAGAERLGPYRILCELGHGGMGRVYLAEQQGEGFRRRVALKLVERRGGDAEVERRFRDERRILAGLEHPGIARFYDAGRSSGGRWFLALEYVEGQDLRAFVEGRGLDLRSRVELFLQVLDAVDFAHRRLVVHRDLKPANVLVDTQGRAKLLDFGISKILDPDHDADATRTERPAFTLAYASPEQLRHERVTVATDVYSAGVMLYELLAGRLPFDRRQLAPEPDPQPPSTVAEGPIRRRDLAGDLDAIVLKALRPSADSRYSSAASFAADLRRWLAGEPVEAHRGGRRYRLAKFAARHRLSLTAAAAVLVALAGGLSVALVQRSRALAAQARAEQTVADMHALTQSMLFEIHEGVQLLPDSLKVRLTVVRRATEALDRLAATAGEDPRLLGDLAAGYERLGALFANHPSLGRSLNQPKAAVGHFQRALALRERLAARPAAGFPERLAAARCLSDLANAQVNAGDAAAAAQSSDEGIRRLGALEPEAPDPAIVRLWLAIAHRRAWQRIQRFPGQSASAERHAAAAVEAWMAFLSAPAPAATVDADLVAETLPGTLLLLREGHPQAALRVNDLGLEALDRQTAAHAHGEPESSVAAHQRIMILHERMNALYKLGRPADALVVAKEMLRREAALPPDAERAFVRSIFSISAHQQAARVAAEARDLEFAQEALVGSERALTEAESRYGAAGFAGSRVEQEWSRADVLVARADQAGSSAERRRLRADALRAYRRALKWAEGIEAGGGHGQLGSEQSRPLREQIQRLEGSPRRSSS